MTANAGYGKGLNMTETEKKNLAMVRLWQELFNDADRMADECYAEDTPPPGCRIEMAVPRTGATAKERGKPCRHCRQA